MSKKTDAWLIEASGGYQFVVAEYEMIEYVIEAELHEIPLTPEYASSVLLWQDQMVAVIDFGLMIERVQELTSNISLLAYQETAGDALKYISVALRSPPKKITIDDVQMCEQEAPNPFWDYLSDSWFTYEGDAVPVLNVQRLGSTEFSLMVEGFRDQTVPDYLKANKI